jgi:RND family efflux transporter MFP subunit
VKKLIRVSAPILVLAVGILVVVGLGAAKPEPEKNEDVTRLVSLYVDKVTAEDVAVTVRTQGEVRPKTEIELVPQVSGRVVGLSENFANGAEFQAGSLLLKIEDTDYEFAVVRAEARVAEAQTEVERELAMAQMKEQDFRDGRSTGEPTAFALNQTQVAQARAMLRSAQADLDKARVDMQRTEIRLPFRGRVRERHVGIGQYVTAGATLGRVFSIDTVEVLLPLTDTQLAEVGLPLGYMAPDAQHAPQVTFSAAIGNRTYHWQGRIVRVSAAVDQQTRLIYATAEVADPYGVAADQGMPIAVGLYVTAEIESRAVQSALVMPRMALRNENKVYVINAENRLEIRTVDVLSTSEDRVLVRAGVVAGERVVTSTLPNAVDGMEVEAIFRDSAGKQG